MKPIRITAHLASELAGVPPQLDGLLVDLMLRHVPIGSSHERHAAAPDPTRSPPIFIDRGRIGGWLVHRVSSPILSPVLGERHEHITQHFPVARLDALAPGERGVIATTNGAQKSMRLPVVNRVVQRVVWFAALLDKYSPKDLRGKLKRIDHIGQDRARGCGRVREWTIEPAEADYSWYAPHPEGTVLMRQLPLGEWLPKNLIGYSRDYDAVCPPYWHADRRIEIARPA